MENSDVPSERATASVRRKASLFAAVATGLMVLIAVAVALEPFLVVHWAMAHPKTDTRHDPHHWLGRLAIVSIALMIGKALWQGLRQMWTDSRILGQGIAHTWRECRAWRRVFLPLPWERQKPSSDQKQPWRLS